MIGSSPVLSIVLLTWNSERHIEACLTSILAQELDLTMEVIVVDNGSHDNTLRIVRKMDRKVEIVQNDKNMGVARGRNIGISRAHGRYVGILDADTVLSDGSLLTLVRYLDRHPDVGLVGPRLTDPDGLPQQSFRRFPTVLSKTVRRTPDRVAALLLKREYYRDADSSKAMDVDYVIGACQVFRSELLPVVGMLDDKMFYGPEDVDFCLRIQNAGWRVVYFPDASITHEEQRVTKKRLFNSLGLQHLRALARYFRKHRYLFSRRRIYKRLGRPPY